MALRVETKRYTYADYIGWGEEVRCELIEGTPYAMAGTSRTHQRVYGVLHQIIGNYLEDKTCEMFSHNFDVRLNSNDYDDTVVQPDIFVVCDPTILDDRSCNGAPDFVIEILSPSTSRRDRTVKLRIYEEAGVTEYWIVDPYKKVVEVYLLNNGTFDDPLKYKESDTILATVLEGCQIKLARVFKNL